MRADLPPVRLISSSTARVGEAATGLDAGPSPLPFSPDVMDALPAAVYTTDAEGRVTSFNKACVSFSGRIPELGTDRWCVTWKLYRPDGTYLPFDECPMATALKEGRSISGAEAIAERPDGSRIWFAAHPTPLYDEHGRLIGGVNMLVDITARKQVELSLSRSAREQGALYRFTDRLQRAATAAEIDEAALDAIVEGLAADRAAILRFDADGVMRFEASRALSEEYCAAVEGHSPWSPDDRDPQCVTIEHAAVSDLDEHLKAVVADEGIAALAFIPLMNAGRLIGKFMVYYDAPHEFESADLALALTIARQLVFARERLRAEEDRRATSEALHEADRRKDEFLATLAHELRNPLGPIHAALPLIQRHQADGAETSRWLEIVGRQTARLTRLVDDLMDVSRITRGHIDLRREPLDLAGLLHRVVDGHADDVASAGMTLDLRLPTDPVMVEADPVRLDQVISNLLSNAIKYSDTGGTITVALTTAEGTAQVTVRDSGVGIEPAFLPRIFRLFEQADRTFDRSKGGVGIGLALARQLVELHGGTITADSPGEGRGSLFSVRIPLMDGAATGIVDSASTQASGVTRHASRCVLIVDDNADYAEVLAEIVTEQGHEVHTARDGVEALRVAEQVRPDVVLLDIAMPGISGYEVAAQLRSSPATSDAVLVAISGYGQPADRERSERAGLDGHMVKPIELDALERILASVDPAGRHAPGA